MNDYSYSYNAPDDEGECPWIVRGSPGQMAGGMYVVPINSAIDTGGGAGMSTRSTIISGEGWHFYVDVNDEEAVYLSLSDDDYIGHRIPLTVWRAMVEAREKAEETIRYVGGPAA